MTIDYELYNLCAGHSHANANAAAAAADAWPIGWELQL